ncbi:MAG: UbiX family flavin prenyltransferase [Planctomycetes bacterium]|nr:UbiX family flavin prenyltransferase [Planctomycetota bacterium]
MKRIIMAITGASGVIYGVRLLQYLIRNSKHEIHLTISAAAAEVLKHELDIIVDLNSRKNVLGKVIESESQSVHYYHFMDLAAPIASGSFKTDGMIIIPCSMGTVGRIASGVSLSLVERAADVCLKERRKLIIVPRETPYSKIHLENMLKITEAGGIVLPASPGFYTNNDTVDDLINFILSRALDHLGVRNELVSRYGEVKKHTV